jgi:hypothetical protein
MRAALLCRVILAIGCPVIATAQSVPSEPVRALDGRLVLSGEAAFTFSTPDNESYFNYTDYERNALQNLRLSLVGLWQPADRLAFVGELRTENFDGASAYAAYVRLRPWRNHNFDIQAGRIPPSFGSFGRRSYSSGRVLIGYPLAYQYLTSLRPDALPATADDLLVMRGRGWRAVYPVGSPEAEPGVPLISAFRWDTGVQARWNGSWLDVASSLTTGTLSYPRISDDNDSKQISGRVGFKPAPGLIAGVSAAHGGWVSDSVPVLPTTRDARADQTAFGADVEYSRDYWLVRGELVWSRWWIPYVVPPPEGPSVDALGFWIEGRYRLSPRWYVAARGDRLDFSRISGTGPARQSVTWEAPVTRVEVGGGYYIRRNVVARASVQYNDRQGGRVRSRTFLSGQVAYWF